MASCLIPDCKKEPRHNLGVRLRRKDGSAIWAQNTAGRLCDEHAEQGCTIIITLVPTESGEVKTSVSAGGKASNRTTKIIHTANE